MNIFKNVAVDIPNKSGFDMSHENFFSSACGTLTPALIDTLLPGDKVDLSAIANVKLPPFASEFFGRIDFKMEAFFVPFRLLYGGWKEFITIPLDYVSANQRPETSPYQPNKVSSVYLPSFELTLHDTTDNVSTGQIHKRAIGAGSLADYLGYKVDTDSLDLTQYTSVKLEIPALPFLAYHKIWDDWYRDSRIVSSCFSKPGNLDLAASNSPVTAGALPYIHLSSSTLANSLTDTNTKLKNYQLFYNGTVNVGAAAINLFDLRQRSFDKDYFTNATPLPQAGNQQSVGFTISNNQGSFSIPSLRAANSIQTWLERNNLAGDRYPDQIKANYGVYPADGITDRCIYLGRVNVPVYSKSVYQTSEYTSSSTQNPMATIGADFGSPQGVKSGRFCKNFEVTEHGYLFVMASLVPTAFYSTGIDRHFYHTKITDFGWPLLQGTGDQAIFTVELCKDPWNASTTTPLSFGYSQRYSEFKFMKDEVHGLLRDGMSLESFALQRSFEFNSSGTATPSIGYLFNQIPTNFLNQVSAVSNAQSDYGYWADVYFNYKKVSTLAAYSIPTLGDLKNVHKEVIPLGGKRL